MSHHEKEESQNPLTKSVGCLFLFLVPFSLVVMLGFIGAAFIQGGGYKAPPPAPEEVVPSASATPVAAPATPEVAKADVTPAAPAATDAAGPPDPGKGEAPAPALGAESPAPSAEQMELGKATYMMCAACHGPDGQGLQAGPQKMAPSFVGSELLLGNPEASVAAVLKGIARKPDSTYLQQMMPLGAGLDDEKIAAVVTYVRNSFGNKAAPVTKDIVASVREKYTSVNAPLGLSREKLEEVARMK